MNHTILCSRLHTIPLYLDKVLETLTSSALPSPETSTSPSLLALPIST